MRRVQDEGAVVTRYLFVSPNASFPRILVGGPAIVLEHLLLGSAPTVHSHASWYCHWQQGGTSVVLTMVLILSCTRSRQLRTWRWAEAESATHLQQLPGSALTQAKPGVSELA